MVLRETVGFFLPESPDVPRDEVDGNIRTRGETKLLVSRGPYIKCFVVYLDFPFSNHIAITKKQIVVLTSLSLGQYGKAER